jgi:hypothetical protein
LLGHPVWEKAFIKVFSICNVGNKEKEKEKLNELVLYGRLPILEKNIQVIELEKGMDFKTLVNEQSTEAGLTIIGFQEELLKHHGTEHFGGYNKIGDVLFVDAKGMKEL